MPADVKSYISSKLRSTQLNQDDKTKLQMQAEKFFQGIVHDSIPTMRRYIDDMIMSSIQNTKYTQRRATVSDLQGNILEVCHKPKEISKNIPVPSQWETELLTRKLFAKDRVELQWSHEGIVQELNRSLAKSCSLKDTNWQFQLPSVDPNFEKSLLPQPVPIPENFQQNCPYSKYFIKHTLQEFSAIEHQYRSMEATIISRQKFSFRSMKFLSPAEFLIENELPLQYKNTQGKLFLMSDQQEQTPLRTHVQTKKCLSAPHKQNKSADHSIYGSVPMLRTSKPELRGLSLNERVLGKRIAPSFDEDQSEFPSFELLDTNKGRGSSPSERIPVSAYVGKNNQWSNTEDKPILRPVVNVNAFEHGLYMKLTTTTTKYSPRIFEIAKVWVDQRTLVLSMGRGGWIHPNVMDTFGQLINTDQYWRDHEGKSDKKDIMRHVVIKDVTKALMDPFLNHNDPALKQLFCEFNVGFRLEYAGLI